MTSQTSVVQEAAINSVSEETKAFVEESLSDEPDQVKQKIGELIEVINQAKATLKKTEDLFKQQHKSQEQSLQELRNETTDKRESFVTDVRKMSDRLDQAVIAAWQTLNQLDDTNS